MVVRMIGGNSMRKLMIVVAAVLVASSPALAKAKKKAAPPAPQPMTQNEASWRLLKESVPLFLPTVASAAYLSAHKDDDGKANKH